MLSSTGRHSPPGQNRSTHSKGRCARTPQYNAIILSSAFPSHPQFVRRARLREIPIRTGWPQPTAISARTDGAAELIIALPAGDRTEFRDPRYKPPAPLGREPRPAYQSVERAGVSALTLKKEESPRRREAGVSSTRQRRLNTAAAMCKTAIFPFHGLEEKPGRGGAALNSHVDQARRAESVTRCRTSVTVCGDRQVAPPLARRLPAPFAPARRRINCVRPLYFPRRARQSGGRGKPREQPPGKSINTGVAGFARAPIG